MLRNLEAAAEGATSPPRFLLMHWPDGTSRQRFLPLGGRSDFTISPILKPFTDAGLRDDLIVLYGLAHKNTCPGGGGSEAGTVFATTGANSEGTRKNGGESDDATAGGPSFDQIFLKRAPRLRKPGLGYINTICDARVDSLETSAQCLSYSYERRMIEKPAGGLITENVPLLPTLRPLDSYTQLFSGMTPGGMTNAEARNMLLKRKSVLDSALRELARLQKLAPSSQAPKIDAHAEAIRQLELQLGKQLDGLPDPTTCTPLRAPDANLIGKSGSKFYYGLEKTTENDAGWLEQVGSVHLQLIRAAFQCDLLRVATFQWCSGNNAVAFTGMYPDDPAGGYRFHPMTHRTGDSSFWDGAPPDPNTGSSYDVSLYEFASNVWTWFNQKTADALAAFKSTTDAFGGSLLDHTVVPIVTEVALPTHARSPLPALILGGKKLGMRGGQFVNLSSTVSQNAMWLAIAQAYFPGQDPAKVLADEAFMNSGAAAVTTPLEGLWQAPV